MDSKSLNHGVDKRNRNSAGTKHNGSLTRFAAHDVTTRLGLVSKASAGAIKEGRTMFTSRVVHPSEAPRLLIDGHNNPKLGRVVTKGPWQGMPIFSLTLQERATCPDSCHHWDSCYGNNMHWSRRSEHGPDLERALHRELLAKQAEHRKTGFLVRLHVLGDFYSVDYVNCWRDWLDLFPALHVFGSTARDCFDPIGRALLALADERWDRFKIRLSTDAHGGEREWVTLWEQPEGPLPCGLVQCPAQTGATQCCGTCGLCWHADQMSIGFVVHGRRHNGGRRPKR